MPVAGTKRGPNTIFRFTLDGLAVAHLGDFGQDALRSEQRAALGGVDVLFVPVGGGPTIGGEPAAVLVRERSRSSSCRCITAPRRSTSSSARRVPGGARRAGHPAGHE
jgi:beta-lactamase family protein